MKKNLLLIILITTLSFNLTAQDLGEAYQYDTSIGSVANTDEDDIPYLTFEALEDGTVIKIVKKNTPNVSTFEYKTGDAWISLSQVTYPYTLPTLNTGDKIMFRSKNKINLSISAYIHFTTTSGKFKVSGNINTIFNYEAADLDDVVLDEYCFCSLFSDCAGLTDASELYMPALSVESAKYCYNRMFAGCTSLTTAPELPATTLSLRCYQHMFSRCTSLTTAPELPATTLAIACYNHMFYGCTSLLTPPELPATTLYESCYSYMFYGCTSLTTAPELPATNLAVWCYTAMFYGCTSLTTAPELPATNLVDRCYSSMFSGCTSLKSVATHARIWTSSSYNYSTDWLSGVSSTGHFYNLGGASIPAGVSGVPSGWTKHTTAATEITVASSNEEFGTVSGGGTFDYGTTINVTATPMDGCVFDGWTENGEIVSTDLEYTFKVVRPMELMANFILIPDYLTLTATQDNTIIGLSLYSNPDISTLQYSYDGDSWNNITGATTFNALQTGQFIKFRSRNQISTRVNNVEKYINFTDQSGAYSVSGNINTLIKYQDVDNAVLGNAAFSYLFNGCSRLTDISGLSLPATTMADYCYYGMFRGCSSLTAIPELPATSLAYGCYWSMFYGCSGLTSVPSDLLPSLTMAEHCYQYMFGGCVSLAAAPNLPSTSLASYCYCGMFEGCSSLTTAPELSATSLASYCYNKMYKDCSSLTTAPELPATTLATSCYESMFEGCTSLITAPELPATSLASYCYYSMFEGCSSLNSVTTQATSWNVNYTNNWLSGVAATGDFYNMGGANIPTGVSGIPTGWTEHGPRIKTITATSNNEEYGTVSGSGTVVVGTTATVTATPADGFVFVNWTENDVEVSTNATYSFTVNGDRNLVANFAVAPDYFTITATQDNTIIGLSLYNDPDISTLQYSYDGSSWNNITGATTFNALQTGQFIKFRSRNQISTIVNDVEKYINFTDQSGAYSVSGNINTLIKCQDVDNAVLGKFAFSCLFKGCSRLTDISGLSLPSTTLAERCYWSMFWGCSGLTDIPSDLLPSLTMAERCYQLMFSGCTSLAAAPNLPSTSLAISCYNQMFKGCSSLTTAPELPATSLESHCYSVMFKGCTSLITAPELPATSLATDCYSCMFEGCTSLNTAPELPATSLASYCYYYMFKGCSSLTTAPELPATSLEEGCYVRMFDGCSYLTTTPELPATTLAYYCYGYMFYGCSSLTTAPELTATSLASDCYCCMFGDCTSLITAPELPATSLASLCYCSMFKGCTSLITAPELPATSLASNCYWNMFKGCTSLIVAPELPATSLASSCYDGMFRGCTSLITAPELPATSLATDCYNGMFEGCTSLNSVTIQATSWNVYNTYVWLSGVAATGDFYNMGGANIPIGVSGIPTGWTEHGPRIKTITATSNNEEYGTVSGSGTVVVGTTATVTATPNNSGYIFVNWTENDVEVSTNATYSFTVNGDRDLVANFALGESHWNPDIHQYSNYTIIIGVVLIDGVEQRTTDYEIGIFCGNELRGSQRPQYCGDDIDRYIVFMNAYGNPGDSFTFKLYDHSANEELALISPAAILFNTEGVGSVSAPWQLDFIHGQDISLHSGWNWCSTFVDVDGTEALAMVKNNLGSSASQIKGYGNNLSYENGNWYGNLSEFNIEEMYMVKMNESRTLTMAGFVADADEHPIQIYNGWTWIGYPVSKAMSLYDAFANFTPNQGDNIKSFKAFAQYFGGTWYGTLKTLIPGVGYMYQNTSGAAKTLVYATSSKSGICKENITTAGNHWESEDCQYADNMCVIATVNVDGEELNVNSIEVAAFCNGEVRGSARPIYVEPFDRYMLFMTVSGVEGDNITFKYFDLETDTENKSFANEYIVYSNNASTGDITEPFELNFSSGGDDVNIYPNPVSDKLYVKANNIKRISVLTVTGLTVIDRQCDACEYVIDMGDLIAGAYIIEIITDNGVSTRKIIKK